MNKPATRFWTFNTLAGAFLDLYIAFLLLWGSTIALFAVKFLNLFGLSLPTLSNELLVNYPTDKVSSVQSSITRKFPSDSVFNRVQNRNPNNDLITERYDDINEGEASCSSKSDARKLHRNETNDSGAKIEKGKGFDLKGKGGLNYRLRSGFRHKRKGSFDSGKHSCVSSSTNWVTCVDQPNNNDDYEGLEASSVNYEGETQMMVKSDIIKRIPANEADKDEMIVSLTRELEESRAARATLYVELDKERNAAASAADEAMSMILRLQEEKAMIEMESRQYQRMIEEKSAYDAEEMNILKEIVLRREREKHFLEKEVEGYRQMIHGENYQDFADSNSRLFQVFDFLKQDEPEKTIAIVEEEKRDDESNETDSRVYDVHVVSHKPKLTEKSKSKSNHGDSDMSVGLPPVSSNSISKSKSSLRRNSTSALDTERTKLDTEVEWLRERLRIVQEGREKLNFATDNREKEGLQLELLEDIARQLQEIRMLTEPQTTSSVLKGFD